MAYTANSSAAKQAYAGNHPNKRLKDYTASTRIDITNIA
jgi:hypothetical protein